MSLPKPDQRLKDSVARLRGHPDFQALMKYQASLYEHYRDVLIGCSPQDFQRMQGKAEATRDLLDLLP